MPIVNERIQHNSSTMTKIRCELDARARLALEWLQSDVDLRADSIAAVSGDASFRRYFRVVVAQQSYVIMDAPPERENVQSFVKVAGLLADAGVNVPEIFAVDQSQGFMLLGDFGVDSYFDQLNHNSVTRLYADALNTLLRIQHGVEIKTAGLPIYDEALLKREIGLFSEWFLQKKLSLSLDQSARDMLEVVQTTLVESALQQPRVCVHRDYHSRNLMVVGDFNPGVLDFQDAVIGPITYDLVSLLRDCYIEWPETVVDEWFGLFHRHWLDSGVRLQFDQLLRWFDLMGMQRHMKAIGIFSRLHLRDGKPGYLADIPRTLHYIRLVSQRYPELNDFDLMLESEIVPALKMNMA